MKLLKAIKEFPADNAVILTYNLDLLFFEYLLFEPWYAAGYRNILVMADPGQYAAALDDLSELRYVGQRYVVSSGRTSPRGAFHPKLILLTSQERGALFLASANLTRSGYAVNWEVATQFEFNAKKPDATRWRACRWGYETIRAIASRSGDALVQERMERLWQTTPWLWEAPAAAETGEERVWWLENLETSLLTQLHQHYQALDAAPVEEIVVISPYFDAELSALAQMQRLFQPHGWRIYTQDAVRAFPQAAAQKLFGPMGNAFQLAELDLEKGRRLHAKTLLLRTRQGAWLMTGSANATAPALLAPAHRGNTELVVVRYEPSPSYFDDWLQDLTQQAYPVSLDDLLPPDEIQEAEPVPSSPPTISIRASLEKDSLCVQVIDPPSESPVPAIRLHQGDRIATTTPSLKPNTSDVWCAPVAAFPGVDVNTPVLVELTWGDEGPAGMAVLHNRQNLARFSRPLSRKDRPKLPPGLYPESDDHALQIMAMLQELLATNTEMLKKHRGPLAARSRRREETLALDEDDYDPEDYFVDEVVRTPIDAESGSSIYSNYHDRLSYEEILSALRAAFKPLVAGDQENASTVRIEEDDGTADAISMSSPEDLID